MTTMFLSRKYPSTQREDEAMKRYFVAERNIKRSGASLWIDFFVSSFRFKNASSCDLAKNVYA
jgi:hypothetical protein